MRSKSPGRALFSGVILFFVITNALFIAGKARLSHWQIDQSVVIVGNLILFLVTALSLYLYKNAMEHPSTAGFLRNSYGGVMLKLFVCAIAVAIYAFIVKKEINKPGLFVCIGLYFVYTVIEMRSLMRWTKERKNA